MATVKIEGLDRLCRQLKALPEELKAEIQPALEKSGEEMVATARALAPVDDGDLRDSITMTTAGKTTPLYGGGGLQTVGDLQVRVTAGNSKTRYAAIVEHGRKGIRATAARPFFWPAYRMLRKRFRGRTARAINKALKKVISR